MAFNNLKEQIAEDFEDVQRLAPELVCFQVYSDDDGDYGVVVNNPADDETFLEHSVYCAPWRDRLSTGKLGPEYGPSMSMFSQDISDYNLRPFWDPEEDANCRAKVLRPKKVLVRKDAQEMANFIRLRGHTLTPRELEVYYAFFVDMLSYGWGANKLRMQKGHFTEMVRTLRRKMNKMLNRAEESR